MDKEKEKKFGEKLDELKPKAYDEMMEYISDLRYEIRILWRYFNDMIIGMGKKEGTRYNLACIDVNCGNGTREAKMGRLLEDCCIDEMDLKAIENKLFNIEQRLEHELDEAL